MPPSIQHLSPDVFHLQTRNSSIVVSPGEAGHLELLWFGDRLHLADPNQVAALRPDPATSGATVTYGRTRDSLMSLHQQPLAFATHGKGDFREPALGVVGQRVLDFTFRHHRIVDGVVAADGLPGADAEPESQTLEITLADDVAGLEVVLRWTTFPHSDVFSRRTEIRNTGNGTVTLDRAASLLLDLPDAGFDVITLDGWWANEARPTRTRLGHQRITNASVTGSSSSEHNPGVLLVEHTATETSGRGYGFNLVYSGSHATTFEGGRGNLVRVAGGINPEGFGWELAPGESFITPEAVMTYSSEGIGGISRNFHRFIDDCIVPAHWRRRPRPVVLNNWEGTYFDFDAPTILEIAERAVELGVETFVLDDGWFGARDDDLRGLGDWVVNTTKLEGGLGALIDGVRALGLDFGLWFEPESINPDSELYRAHPEWAIHQPSRTPSEGRHQYLLDLTRSDVRDHLVTTVGGFLDEYPISFVKWDMNRLISDAAPDGFHHRYILGLYDVLGRIFGPRPEVLLENCSSGGNRFDLGVLSFGPQIWTSDCTDPVERLAIQEGISLLYPASTISAHVSASPNHQTGRASSLDYRFAVSAPYVFGVELDPRTMPAAEITALGERITWYKQRRALLQFGEHHRVEKRGDGRIQLTATDGERAVSAYYTTHIRPGSHGPVWQVPGLDGAATARRVFGEGAAEPTALHLPDGVLGQGVAPPTLGEGEAALFDVTRISG